MLTKDRIKNYPRHPSSRGEFGFALYKAMAKNPDIYLILPDLGYKIFDSHIEDFPGRVIVIGAQEQGGMGLCVGLALKGKIPFMWSVTNFVLYRPFEWVRNYLNHESIPVKLIGSGRDKDYSVDGFTHESEDAKYVLGNFPNIVQFWPMENTEIEGMVKEMVKNKKPSFISLKR